MSLSSSLNSPPLIASLGIGAVAGLPKLDKLILEGAISFAAIKALNGIAYAANIYAVSQPGRIDGQQQRESTSTSSSSKNIHSKEMEQLAPRSGRTLVAPSGWAFAIWGPIFAGEMVFSISQLFLKPDSALAPLIRQISAPFVLSQVCQVLWSAAFRPKYDGNLMYISAGLLLGTAYSLSKAHAVFSLVNENKLQYSFLEYLQFFLPISLHFGWTTAASLVNFNGAVAMKENASPKVVAVVGHLSVVVATVVGVFVTLTRSAPVYGGVIAWALSAVADGMKQRLEKSKETSKKEDRKDEGPTLGMYGARTQHRLSQLGAFVSALASAAVVVLKK